MSNTFEKLTGSKIN